MNQKSKGGKLQNGKESKKREKGKENEKRNLNNCVSGRKRAAEKCVIPKDSFFPIPEGQMR